MSKIKYFQHLNNINSNDADFIVQATVENNPLEREQIYAKQIDKNIFEIRCVPFFAFGIAYGDIVTTSDEYLIEGVLKPSENKNLRLWIKNMDKTEYKTLISKVTEIEIKLEAYNDSLIGISVAKDELDKVVSIAKGFKGVEIEISN